MKLPGNVGSIIMLLSVASKCDALFICTSLFVRCASCSLMVLIFLYLCQVLSPQHMFSINPTSEPHVAGPGTHRSRLCMRLVFLSGDVVGVVEVEVQLIDQHICSMYFWKRYDVHLAEISVISKFCKPTAHRIGNPRLDQGVEDVEDLLPAVLREKPHLRDNLLEGMLVVLDVAQTMCIDLSGSPPRSDL